MCAWQTGSRRACEHASAPVRSECKRDGGGRAGNSTNVAVPRTTGVMCLRRLPRRLGPPACSPSSRASALPRTARSAGPPVSCTVPRSRPARSAQTARQCQLNGAGRNGPGVGTHAEAVRGAARRSAAPAGQRDKSQRKSMTHDTIRYNQRRIYRHLYPRSSLAPSLGFRDCLRLPHAHSARRRGGAGIRVGVLQPRCATRLGGHARVATQVATATRARSWSAASEGQRAGGRSAISLGSQFPADSSWSILLELPVCAAPRMGAWRMASPHSGPAASVCVHDQRGGV